MSNPWKDAFDSIHADEALKARTKDYLKRTVYRSSWKFRFRRIRPALAAACLVLVLGLGGSYLYFTPTAWISIDVNPSLELGINRFDRVVTVEGYNADGEQLADTLEVRYLNYQEALDQILADQQVVSALDQDGVLSLTVAGNSETQCDEIYQAMESCSSGHENIQCHVSSSELLEQAHGAGLSLGKYQAFLILQSLDPSITVDQVQDLSMGELFRMIRSYESAQGNSSASWNAAGSSDDSGHGQGHGHRHGADHLSSF